MEKKITVFGVIGEGFSIGMKNSLSLLGAVILYILTIWVPYINVGTTIAMCSIPIELSKGKVISPMFIFDAKYRKYMGEFFLLAGFISIAILPLIIFGFIPAIVISFAWSLSVFLLIDRGVSPGDALVESNLLTYGYKWKLFFISVVLGLIAIIALIYPVFVLVDASRFSVYSFESMLPVNLPWWPVVVIAVILLLVQFISLGASAVIYRNLTAPVEPTVEPKVAQPKQAPIVVIQEKIEVVKVADMPKVTPKPVAKKPTVKKVVVKKTPKKDV